MVIAIIGMLSSVVLASLSSARVKARDAKRISDFKQLNMAISLYYDNNNAWPCLGLSGSDTYIEDQTHCLASVLVPNYIASIPTDPRYGGDGARGWGSDYQYQASDSSTYLFRTAFEGTPLKQNTTYPNGTTCTSGSYSTCAWFGNDCIYVTGGSCDRQWIHTGQK